MICLKVDDRVKKVFPRSRGEIELQVFPINFLAINRVKKCALRLYFSLQGQTSLLMANFTSFIPDLFHLLLLVVSLLILPHAEACEKASDCPTNHACLPGKKVRWSLDIN